MTTKRHPDKVHFSAYITKEEKAKMRQLKYELGCETMTDLLRHLIKEREAYGKYPAPELIPDSEPKSNSNYKYDEGETDED